MARLAVEYILGSHANIRVLIGIDVQYKGIRESGFTIVKELVAAVESVPYWLLSNQTVPAFASSDFRNNARDVSRLSLFASRRRCRQWASEAS